MNKFRFLIAAIVLLFLLNAGTLVYLLMAKKQPPLPPGERVSAFIIEQLKLDRQQQDQFFELRRQHQEATHQIREEDRRLHDIYFDLLKTDNPDKSIVDSIASLIAGQRKLMESATFEHFQQLRKLCRDDQKKLFDSTIDEIMRQMGPKGPPMEGPPGER